LDKTKLLFGILLISSLASASCFVNILKGTQRDTTGRPIDLTSFDAGQNIIFGYEVTKQVAGERTTLDTYYYDPLGFYIGGNLYELSGNLSYVEGLMNTTNAFVNGTYTVSAVTNEYDANNTLVCTATQNKTLWILSPRVSYSVVDVNVTSDLSNALTEQETCREANFTDTTFNICASGLFPSNFSIQIVEVDTTNYSGRNFSNIISVEQPMYSFNFVRDVVADWSYQTYLNGQLIQLNNESQIQIGTFASELSQVNRAERETLQANNDKLTKENADLKGSVSWAWVYGGLIVLILVGLVLAYFKIKSEETQVD